MAKRVVFDTQEAKEFTKVFAQFCSRRSAWSAWSDYITLTACSISVVVDHSPERFKERSSLLQTTMDRYTEEEIAQFDAMNTILMDGMTKNPQQDFLGRLYMSLDFGSTWHGQYFTPWEVSYMMAKMTLATNPKQAADKPYFSVCDNACGSGCLLIATAAAYTDLTRENGRYDQDVLFVGQDMDPVVAKMCYIQRSLLGCAGYVAVGNSLTTAVKGPDLFPSIGEGGELWFTPMWFTPVWQGRRDLAYLKAKLSS